MSSNGRRPWKFHALLATFIVAGLSTLLTGVWGYRQLRDDHVNQQRLQLLAIADLKIGEIAGWLSYRMADAEMIRSNPFLADEFETLYRNPADAAAKVVWERYAAAMSGDGHYETVALLDREGAVLLASGSVSADFSTHVRTMLRQPGGMIGAYLSDLHLDEDGHPHLAIFAPIQSRQEPPVLLGYLYARIDPGLWLFPLVKKWPTPSPSGETLLVRREGDQVVFLNELRHRGGTALRLKLPAATAELPAGRAVAGVEDFMEGRDYRGVRVFAVTRRVPGTAWHLVAKVDREEVLAGVAKRGRTVFAVAVLGYSLFVTLVLLAWRQQGLRALREQLATAARHRREIESAAEAERQSAMRYCNLFQHMAEGFAYCRMYYDGASPSDYEYLDVNDAFEKLTGLRGVVGRRVSEVIPGIRENDPALLDFYGRVARGGAPERIEIYVASLRQWFSISAYATAPEHFVSVFAVITERKLAEAALEQVIKDLRRSNEELQQFAYIASHDLQEPLRMISSFLQLIERRYADRLDGEGREFIGFAVQGAERLQAMIRGLLAYSRAERSAIGSGAEAERALATALENLRVLLEEADATVTHDPLPAVRCDEGQLVQVFQNLVENAVKFRGPGPPRVHVSARRVGGAAGAAGDWEIAVGDNGVGIEPRHLERIFGIFRRLHGQLYPGAGIGLALCRRILERHGGGIRVESTPGQGSTFFVRIAPAGGPQDYAGMATGTPPDFKFP